MSEFRLIQRIEDLLDIVELLDIRFFELSGVVDRTALGGPEGSTEYQSPTQLQLGQSDDRRQIGVTVRVETKTDIASFVVEAAVEYACSEPVELTEDVKVEFANRLAFMNLVPFVREGLITTAARLRVNPPIIPIIPGGMFTAGQAIEEPSEAAAVSD